MRLYAAGIGHYRMTHWGCSIHLIRAKDKREARKIAEELAAGDHSVWGPENISLRHAGSIDTRMFQEVPGEPGGFRQAVLCEGGEMKISKTWLHKRRACREGLKWFIQTFPPGFDTEKDYWPAKVASLQKEWLGDLIIILLFSACYPSGIAFDGTIRSWDEGDYDRHLILDFMDRVYVHRPERLRESEESVWDVLMFLDARTLNRALREVARRYDDGT